MVTAACADMSSFVCLYPPLPRGAQPTPAATKAAPPAAFHKGTTSSSTAKAPVKAAAKPPTASGRGLLAAAKKAKVRAPRLLTGGCSQQNTIDIAIRSLLLEALARWLRWRSDSGLLMRIVGMRKH